MKAGLDKAIRIASQAFEGVFDKGGEPYILHCLHVMNDTRHPSPIAKIVGVLHDLFEDCPEWNEERLMGEGFSAEICQKLRLLSHDKSVSYDDYIAKIAMDPICKEIKKADLRHNSNITRLKDVRKKDFDRLQKYSLAYKYLSE